MDYSFEKLIVWQEARKLVKSVYLIVEKFPDIERYGLSSQLRRAVISVPSNIVEGNIKKSNKEKLHYFEIAYGSLMEVYCQMILAHDLNYIDEEQINNFKMDLNRVSMLLSRLRNSIESK